jgi:hypothetical protein
MIFDQFKGAYRVNSKKLAFLVIVLLIVLTACSQTNSTTHNVAPTADPKEDSGTVPVEDPVAEVNPDPIVEVFGEGVLYMKGEFPEYATFSPDGKTIFFNKLIFTPLSAILYESQLIDGMWSEPKIPSYAGENTWESHSVLSFDNKRLLFNSKRDSGDDFYIWVADRKEDGSWGEPKALFKGSQPALASNGNLYFTRDPLKLYRAVWSESEGAYAEPELIDAPFNAGTELAMSPYISPDERYMIYSKNDMHLYVSYYVNDEWTNPAPLLYKNGTTLPGFAAYVSHDQQTLYTFNGTESSTIYTTDMSMIDIETPQP